MGSGTRSHPVVLHGLGAVVVGDEAEGDRDRAEEAQHRAHQHRVFLHTDQSDNSRSNDSGEETSIECLLLQFNFFSLYNKSSLIWSTKAQDQVI